MTRDEMEADLRIHGFGPCMYKPVPVFQGWGNPAHTSSTVINTEIQWLIGPNSSIQASREMTMGLEHCALSDERFQVVYNHIVKENYL